VARGVPDRAPSAARPEGVVAVKLVKRSLLAIAVLAGELGALYVAMAERVEVVVVHTGDTSGDHATRVWVVDDAGSAWLRTGADNATWLPRLRTNPEITLERGGAVQPFRAVVVEDDATVARVNELSLAKYGWSEQLLRAITPADARQLAIRLDPR
jgi:hypothetical protein